MNEQTYQTEALRTESISSANLTAFQKRMLHATMGISTESAELLDALKKHIFYSKDVDMVNIVEEIGDLYWYLAILKDEIRITDAEIRELNIAKLRKRYPGKFDSDAAINRNLDEERKALEGKQ